MDMNNLQISSRSIMLLSSAIFLWGSISEVSGQECGHGLSFKTNKQYLERLKGIDNQVNNFAPSVYYKGKSTKFISTQRELLNHPWLCVDGATSYQEIDLYDDGTHGDDFADDGIYTRDCVHYCASRVDLSDYFGFAMVSDVNSDAKLIVMDESKEGTVPYDVVKTDLTPDGKAIASSHAFFFADTNGKYYPNFPKNLEPNSAANPDGANIVVSALMQGFGDVFDYVTVTPMESSDGAIEGAGIYKWQNWDRRGGPTFDSEIGRPGVCITAVAGIPIQRLTGVITNGDIVTGDGFTGQLHELTHGVSGYEYNRALDAARTGDGAHVPGSCTLDHSSLQGPVWDWKEGYPNAILNSTGDSNGVRLLANADCESCADSNLSTCCSFRYENIPTTHDSVVANPELSVMSPLMLYIAGMIKADELGSADKTYYCMGSDTDGGCGTLGDQGQEPCVHTVDDSDWNRVTSNFVSRFTFGQLKNAVGGKRFPEKKFDVIRHAAVHLSMREPTESEITFYTLLWRQHEIQKTPWKRLKNTYNNLEAYPIVPWYFNTGGKSILHSRLHGIDCDYPGTNSGGGSVPSCSSGTDTDVCSGAPCGPGAICKNLDGQPLCLCREGLVGDGYECAFPSETEFASLATAHELASLGSKYYQCFAKLIAGSPAWPTFTEETTLPPYPGGQAPYAPTTCYDFGVCPSDWRCTKAKGCLPPTGRGTCENEGFSRGQCEAMGCCKWDKAQSGGDTCMKQQQMCPKPEDKNTEGAKCDDQETCCYFGCNALELEDNGLQLGQKGNCQKDCTIGIAPAYNGVVYEEVYLLADRYYTNENVYGYYEEGPLNIQGTNKNMFERCLNVCFRDKEDDPTAVFLKNIRRKDGKLTKKTCKWLKNRPLNLQKRVCRFSLATQGYKPAKDVCTDICASNRQRNAIKQPKEIQQTYDHHPTPKN